MQAFKLTFYRWYTTILRKSLNVAIINYAYKLYKEYEGKIGVIHCEIHVKSVDNYLSYHQKQITWYGHLAQSLRSGPNLIVLVKGLHTYTYRQHYIPLGHDAVYEIILELLLFLSRYYLMLNFYNKTLNFILAKMSTYTVII